MRVQFLQRLVGAAEGRAALSALVLRDVDQLRRGRYPPLYSGAVRYRTSRGERGHWKTLRELMESGFGDCADLAAARVAELIVSGEDRRARPVVRSTKRSGLYHVVVRRKDGSIEDPSKILGMKGVEQWES